MIFRIRGVHLEVGELGQLALRRTFVLDPLVTAEVGRERGHVGDRMEDSGVEL